MSIVLSITAETRPIDDPRLYFADLESTQLWLDHEAGLVDGDGYRIGEEQDGEVRSGVLDAGEDGFVPFAGGEVLVPVASEAQADAKLLEWAAYSPSKSLIGRRWWVTITAPASTLELRVYDSAGITTTTPADMQALRTAVAALDPSDGYVASEIKVPDNSIANVVIARRLPLWQLHYTSDPQPFSWLYAKANGHGRTDADRF